ncbi:hypothetical protein D9M71_838470 [compost metagenome]
MTCIVIGEVPSVRAVADDKKLDKAQQRGAVAITGTILVVHDLLHSPTRADGECLQLDLHHWHAIDE